MFLPVSTKTGKPDEKAELVAYLEDVGDYDSLYKAVIQSVVTQIAALRKDLWKL